MSFSVSVDAVYAAAHAVHNIIADECGTDPFYFCDKLKPAPLGPQLLKYLRNVSFLGTYTPPRFDTDLFCWSFKALSHERIVFITAKCFNRHINLPTLLSYFTLE